VSCDADVDAAARSSSSTSSARYDAQAGASALTRKRPAHIRESVSPRASSLYSIRRGRQEQSYFVFESLLEVTANVAYATCHCSKLLQTWYKLLQTWYRYTRLQQLVFELLQTWYTRHV
jgi:hypothetical protein